MPYLYSASCRKPETGLIEKAMRVMVPLMVAIGTPIVVLESATHLYFTIFREITFRKETAGKALRRHSPASVS